MNMTIDRQAALADLKALQLSGRLMPCPRCGRDAMQSHPLHNALSRHADVLICDSCGMDEALRDMKRKPMPVEDWARFRNPDLFMKPC